MSEDFPPSSCSTTTRPTTETPSEQLRCLEERRAAFEKQQAILKERERAAYRRGIMPTASLALVVIGLISALAIYAFFQRHEAQEKTKEADEQKQRALIEKSNAVTASVNLEAMNRDSGTCWRRQRGRIDS